MLGVYFLAFCLATGRASTIAFKINVGNADYDKHLAYLHSRKFNDGEGFLGSRREGSQGNDSTVRCHDQTNANERCGDAFLTDIEKRPMISGFLPKPMSYQGRHNVLREQVYSIPAPEDRFSVDDSLPLPFRSFSSRKPILKGQVRGPSVGSGERVILPDDRPVGPGFPPKPVGYLGKPNVTRVQETTEPTLRDRFLVDDTPPSPSASLRNGYSIKGGVRKLHSEERRRLVEERSLGPGFPTKPVGYLVKPKVSREQVLSTPTPEGLFLEDDIPLLPPPTLKSRPIPKGGLKRPHFHGTAIQRLTKENAHPVTSSPLFYEDLPPLETKESESLERKEQLSAKNEDSEEQNNAYNDSFNELDHPHTVKERPCPEYGSSQSKEVDGGRTSAPRNEKENRNKAVSEELATTPRQSEKEEEAKSPEQSIEEEGSRYSDEEETKSPEESVEEEGSHYEEQDRPVLEYEGGGYLSESSEEEVRPYHESVEEERPNITNSEEYEEPSSEVIPDEERPDLENSNEGQIQPSGPPEEQETPIAEHSGEQAGSLSSEEVPDRQHSLEYNGPNLSHSKEYENPETSHSAEDSLENPQPSREVNTAEETDSGEKNPHSDDSEENDGVNSLEESDEGPSYRPQSAEEGSNDESTEVAQKPGSSLENISKAPPNSEECADELPPDSYESFEENSPSYEEDQQKPSLEYQDNEKPPDYYHSTDYGNLSPETEYEDIQPKPWQEHDRRPQAVYYGERPPPFLGGPKGQMKDPSSYPDYTDTNFKPPNYEDNKLKQSEESDSSTPSAEHLSSSSEENLSIESDSTEEDPDRDKTPQDENNVSKKPVETPVAIITSTTHSTTKCTGNDETTSTAAPIDLKRLKKPLGTAKPKPPQIGDVVDFTRARPSLMRLTPATQATPSTRKPVTIAALGIMKPGGSIIAKVVSPTLQVLSSTTVSSTKANDDQMEAPVAPSQSPWRTLLAAREATALTYLKPPPFGQAHTWLLRKRRETRTE